MIAVNVSSKGWTVFCATFFLFLSALLYRAVPNARAHFDIDSPGYDRVAKHFSKTGCLREPDNIKNAPIQTVGYHFFLGIVYSVFGNSYAMVVWLQVLIMLLSWLLLVVCTRQLFQTAVANVVAFLSAINLGFLVYPQFLLAETITLLFLMGFFQRFIAFYQTQRVVALVQAGLLLGVSVLIKPVALIYPCFLVPIVLCFMPSAHKLRHTLLLIACIYAPVLMYMTRNYVVYERFALAPMTSLNMYQCFLSKVIAEVEGEPVEKVRTVRLKFRGTHSFDEAGWREGKKLFFTYLHQYPMTFVRVWLRNVVKTLFGLYSTQLKVLLEPNLKGGECSFFKMTGTFLQRLHNYIVCGTDSRTLQTIGMLEAVWTFIRWLLVLGGFFVLFHQQQYIVATLCGSYLFVCAFVTGIDGCCRYRVMFEPILILLTALSLCAVYYRLTQKKEK